MPRTWCPQLGVALAALQGGAPCCLGQSLLGRSACVGVWRPAAALPLLIAWGLERARACRNVESTDLFQEGFPLPLPFLLQVSAAREEGKGLLRVCVLASRCGAKGSPATASRKSLSTRGAQQASSLSCCFATAGRFLISRAHILT